MSVDLNKIRLGYSELTDSILLYRHGKDIYEALDKRDAEKDVLLVLTEKMMSDAPKGSTQVYRFGKQRYKLSVIPISDEEYEKEKEQK